MPCTPLCKILNTPVISICLVKQNDGTWIEKHQRFLFNVYKRFFLYFCHVFFTFFNVFYFFLERFFTSMMTVGVNKATSCLRRCWYAYTKEKYYWIIEGPRVFVIVVRKQHSISRAFTSCISTYTVDIWKHLLSAPYHYMTKEACHWNVVKDCQYFFSVLFSRAFLC